MPTYHTPPPTPPPASPVSSEPRRRRARSRSRSDSYSRSSSSPSRRGSVSDTKEESMLKTSLVFLGSVAAATFCAHKFWPKGITYGEKEQWEMEKKAKRAKKELRDGKTRARREDGRASPAGYAGREERRAMYRDGGRSSGYVVREDSYVSRERSRGPPRERVRDVQYDRYDRDVPRDRDRSRDRVSDRASSRDRGERVIVERRPSRREPSYYPPAPQRYAIDRSGSTAGSRRSSQDRSRSRIYYDDPEPEPEPAYVYRDPPSRSRRASVDVGGGRRRYDDDGY